MNATRKIALDVMSISLGSEITMSNLRVSCFSLSIDGFGAGPQQSLENPLGVGGLELQEWFFPTATFQRMHGGETGTTGIDNGFAARGVQNIGAWIVGRNMFGPIRGPWPDNQWQGWWGDNPPFHTPVFVITHHAREPVTMAGGTTFYFVTEGIHSVWERARTAAGGLDVRLGGGVATIRQFLRAGLINELHFALAPILLGSGENLFSDINLLTLGYKCVEHMATDKATHFVLRKA